MASIFWAAKLATRLVYGAGRIAVSIARVVLRGIISAAVKLEETLPNIVDTMNEVDPGQNYAEWAQQYRTLSQGNALEEKLAVWPKDLPIDDSVLTYQNFRRARKYRYIFTALIDDSKMGSKQWKMFSMYSNNKMSPDELKRAFEYGYFTDNYENNVHVSDLILKRVQQWIAQE